MSFKTRVDEIIKDRNIDTYKWRAKYGAMSIQEAILQAAIGELVPEKDDDSEGFNNETKAGMAGWNEAIDEMQRRIYA